MKMHTTSFPALLAAIVALLAPPAFSQIEIDPSRSIGATVRYFAWDLKGWKDIANSPERAQKLYGETPANLVRISMEATAHREDGSVDESLYGPMFASIANIRAVNPSVKIFASLKLKEAETFPAWIASDEDGTIFNAKVKCPDPKKFGHLVADYIVWLSKKDIALDFLGLNNEVNEALTAKRYVETAKVLMEELGKRGLDAKFRSFQFVGAEGFGVPTSIRYAEATKSSRGLDYAHIWGSHYYPDLNSGSIDDWAKLAKVAPDRPLWHTELHMRESDDPAENIAKVRDGLAILFKTNQMGVQGYGWWARAHEDDKFANLIRRKAIVSLLNGACIKTSGQYEAKDNKPAAELAQATRVGDTVWLWYCNPGQAKAELPILLKSGSATKASGETWSGGGTANAQTLGTLDVSVADGAKVIVKNLPATSVALVRIDLTASTATPAKSSGVLVADREWSSADPIARKILAALVSVSNGIGHFKRPDGSTFDYPLNKLSAADRKVAEDAAAK
jgi:hypothetical protein